MDSNQKFWISIWQIVCIFSCVVVIMITSCNMRRDGLVAKAIENGASPSEASLAYSYDAGSSSLIMMKFAAEKSK
jgi:hypothetical protein